MSRRSFGGRVVEDSIAAVGGPEPGPDVALVETAPPRRRPWRTVLAQNAWTVIDRAELRRLLEPYPRRDRRRFHARRALTALNLRRTDSVVTLSEAMAALVRARGHAAEVCPVTLPVDVCRPEGSPRRPSWVPEGRRLLVVPGSVTPYKGTAVVVDALARARRPLLDDVVVVLAGAADGTGYLEDLRQAARGFGVAVLQGTVDRQEMRWLLAQATATVVPSRLESLGLGLAEALALSGYVVASPLAAHREVAGRLGREPSWLPGPGGDEHALDALAQQLEDGGPAPAPPPDLDAHVDEWRRLAVRLA